MNCPICKNPVADENSVICEWCGADLASGKIYNLNAELLDILSEKPTLPRLTEAVALYRSKTGCKESIAKKYVSALWHNNFKDASAKLQEDLKQDFWKFYGCLFWVPVIGWLAAFIYMCFPELKKLDIQKASNNLFSPMAQDCFKK